MTTQDQAQDLTQEQDINQEVSIMIEQLNTEGKLTNKDIAAKLNEVIDHLNNMPTKSSGGDGDTVRDIKSDRSMTAEDAEQVLLGDLKDVSTKEAAKDLNLSYGQVYSCRKGFTFKKVYKEYREAIAASTLEQDTE